MKVVVNAGYGGFGLSVEAGEALVEAGCGKLVQLGRQSAFWCGPRHDARLVRVVEQMGTAANSDCSSLEVVTLDDGPYRIVEHDGVERVETPATIEWVSV